MLFTSASIIGNIIMLGKIPENESFEIEIASPFSVSI